jgi:uncharacterized protein (DUF2336 family)
MSQFAAQPQAGSLASPRQGGLGQHVGDPRTGPAKRGTAHGFALLKQKLKTKNVALVPAADPVPAPSSLNAPVRPGEPFAHPETPGVEIAPPEQIMPVDGLSEGAGESEFPILPVTQADGHFAPGPAAAGIEAFDFPGLLGAVHIESPVDVDLSSVDEPMSKHSLLAGTVPQTLPAGPDAPLQAEAGEANTAAPAATAVNIAPAPADEPRQGLPEQQIQTDLIGDAPLPPDLSEPSVGQEGATERLKLLLEPALPSNDEFSLIDVAEFFASAPDAAPRNPPDASLDAQQQSFDAARSTDYRFWEEEGNERQPSEALDLDHPQSAEAHIGTDAAAEESGSSTASLIDGQPFPVDEAISADGAPRNPSPEPKPAPDSRRRAAILRQAREAPSEEAGEMARSLLEIMSLPANTTQPQERALAADTLLHLVHRLPIKSLVAVAERLSMMESPPPLILAHLIHDQRIEVAGPLLEKCSAIDDHDLIEVIADGHQQSNRMIARRRSLTAVLCDALIATGDTSVILTLVRNPGAMISHEAFYRLNELANVHHSLQAPLATRSDLPAPVAFELFWVLPVELRRYVISRFLTDSSTLDKILKLTMRMDSEQQETAPARFPSPEDIDRLLEFLLAGNRSEAERLMSSLLGLHAATAARILSDPDGEPLTVALKAMGATRSRFEAVFSALHAIDQNTLRPSRSAAELQSFFESMSFNKARVLVTYWDWAMARTGPYAALTV